MDASRLAVAILAIGLGLLQPVEAPCSTDSADDFHLRGPDGQALEGVLVSVVGRTGAVTTDPEGRFQLDPEPAPPFDVVVFDAAGAVLGTVRVTELDSVGSRSLVLDPTRVENVSVVSGVTPTTIASPAAAATVLSREEQEALQPERLVDAMEFVPGVDRSGSGQTAVPTVRGLARGRTLILLDGARVTAERRAGPSATYLDPFSLEHIEIVRGPGSVAYGSDAIGGVVHARTSRPRPDRLGGRFALGGGAGRPQISAAGEINVPVGSGAILAQAHARKYDDYDSPQGRVPNSSARDDGGLLRGRFPAGQTRLSFGLQVDRGRDIERPANDVNLRVTRYPIEDSERLTFEWDVPSVGPVSEIGLQAFLGQYRLVTERDTFATEAEPLTRNRSDVDARDASIRFVAGAPLARSSIRFGIDAVSRFDLHAVESETLFPVDNLPEYREQVTIDSADRIDIGLFGEAERSFSGGRRTLALGLRGDHISTHNRGGSFGDRSTSEFAPSGYLAIRQRLDGSWEISVQAAAGYRDPTLSDRYFRGTTARGTITGNPDLVPETSRQLDVAVRGTPGKLRLATFGYLYRIRNLIERFEVAEDEFQFRNRGQQEIFGLELEADYLFGPRLSARATLAYVRGEILDDGSNAADIPAPTATLSVHHRPTKRWWWRLAATLVARDDRPGETEVPTPRYALLGGTLGFRFNDHVGIRLVLGNLTDTAYPASSDRRAPFAPGRSAVAVLAGDF